jgi:thymidylate kinase
MVNRFSKDKEVMKHNQYMPTTQRSIRNIDGSNDLENLFDTSIAYEPPTLGLIQRLCQAFETEKITYCHWKSNNALDRSASGDNDVDLLVSRADILRFTEILCRLGFKQAKTSVEKQMPGVQDYYGYDEEADRLVHVHAHYQLILGHDMTKNHRLPIEKPYLDSAVKGALFRIPAPEFEFIIFVIRMILKHSTWDAILSREGTLIKRERQELAYLLAHINQDRVYDLLSQHLPYIDAELFDNCIEALQPGCSTWTRIKAGQWLRAKLQANARHSLLADVFLKLWRRGVLTIRRRIFKSSVKHRLESGGAMIAIVGGDGAGKSTVVDGLYDWLSKDFDIVKMHLGKPAWSTIAILVRGILKIGQILGLYPLESTFRETLEQSSLVSSGYPFLLREACRARDRYLTYSKARRFAANGGLVILDRFPLPQIKLMDGPQAERFIRQLMDGPQAKRFMSPHLDSPIAKFLVRIEESYYRRIQVPELLIVLRVDPEIAVRRKTGDDATSVRERSMEISAVNWEHTNAHIIDSSKSKTDVLTEVKALIWSEL